MGDEVKYKHVKSGNVRTKSELAKNGLTDDKIQEMVKEGIIEVYTGDGDATSKKKDGTASSSKPSGAVFPEYSNSWIPKVVPPTNVSDTGGGGATTLPNKPVENAPTTAGATSLAASLTNNIAPGIVPAEQSLPGPLFQQPTPAAISDDERYAAIANSDAGTLMKGFQDGMPAFDVKDPNKQFKYLQTRQGKVGEILNNINRGNTNVSDMEYLNKVAPKAAQQAFSFIMKDEDPALLSTKEGVEKFVQRVNDFIPKQEREAKVNYYKGLDAELKGEINKSGLDAEKLSSSENYRKNALAWINRARAQELADIEKQFPVRYIAKGSLRAPYDEVDQASKDINTAKREAAQMKWQKLLNYIGLSYANDYAEKNPTYAPIEIGLEYLKVADPDKYTLRERAGGHGPIDRDLAQIGVNALYAKGDTLALNMYQTDENELDDKYPDKIMAETYHRIGAELAKDQNWAFNPQPNMEMKDRAADQLPQKYRDVYYKHIRPLESRYLLKTGVPMQGLLNKIGEGFYTTAVETGKTIGDWTGMRSTEDQAQEALSQMYNTQFQDVGENAESKEKLKALNNKIKEGKKLTIDELEQKRDLETFTNVRSRTQKILDITGNVTGQVLFQALATKGLGATVTPALRSAGIVRAAQVARGLTTEETIAATATNIGLSQGTITNLAAGAVAFASSYDAALRDSYYLFPSEKDDAKRNSYATYVGFINAITERIFKDEKILSAFNKQIRPNVKNLVNQLAAGKITREALAPAMATLLKKSALFTKYAATANVEESFEELAASAGQSFADMVLAPSKFNSKEAYDKAINSFTTMFTGGGIVSSMAGVRGVRANYAGIPAISQLGVDKRFTENVRYEINQQLLDGILSPAEADEKIKVLNSAAKINTEVMPKIDAVVQLSEQARQKYSVLLLNEKVLADQISQTDDAVLIKKLQSKISESEALRNKILDKDVFVDDDYSVKTEDEMQAQQAAANNPADPNAVQPPAGTTQPAAPGSDVEQQIRDLETQREAELEESKKKGQTAGVFTDAINDKYDTLISQLRLTEPTSSEPLEEEETEDDDEVDNIITTLDGETVADVTPEMIANDGVTVDTEFEAGRLLSKGYRIFADVEQSGVIEIRDVSELDGYGSAQLSALSPEIIQSYNNESKNEKENIEEEGDGKSREQDTTATREDDDEGQTDRLEPGKTEGTGESSQDSPFISPRSDAGKNVQQLNEAYENAFDEYEPVINEKKKELNSLAKQLKGKKGDAKQEVQDKIDKAAAELDEAVGKQQKFVESYFGDLSNMVSDELKKQGYKGTKNQVDQLVDFVAGELFEPAGREANWKSKVSDVVKESVESFATRNKLEPAEKTTKEKKEVPVEEEKKKETTSKKPFKISKEAAEAIQAHLDVAVNSDIRKGKERYEIEAVTGEGDYIIAIARDGKGDVVGKLFDKDGKNPEGTEANWGNLKPVFQDLERRLGRDILPKDDTDTGGKPKEKAKTKKEKPEAKEKPVSDKEEEIRKELEEKKKAFFNSLKASRGKLSIGVDPDAIAKGVDLLATYAKLGIYKFSEVIRDFISSFGSDAITKEDVDAIKGVYAYNRSNLPRAERTNLDTEDQIDEFIENELPTLINETPETPAEPSREDLINEAKEFADYIKDEGYYVAFMENPEQSLSEIAEQVNGGGDAARQAQNTFGKRITAIAIKLFPDAKFENKPATEETTIKQPENVNTTTPVSDAVRGDQAEVPGGERPGVSEGTVQPGETEGVSQPDSGESQQPAPTGDAEKKKRGGSRRSGKRNDTGTSGEADTGTAAGTHETGRDSEDKRFTDGLRTTPENIEDRNHVIAPDDVIVPEGNVAKFNANMNALIVLRRLEAEKRNATPEEKKILAQFVGWGGLAGYLDDRMGEMSDFFRVIINGGQYKYGYRSGEVLDMQGLAPDLSFEQMVKMVQQRANSLVKANSSVADAFPYGMDKGTLTLDEVRKALPAALLTPEEFTAAQASTINAHYTARPVINQLWNLAGRLGFTGGNVLESSAGVGHFFGLMPAEMSANSNLTGFELDSITGRILRKLYPQANIQVKGFQYANVSNNSIDLAISNVPFGTTGLVQDANNKDIDDFSLHNYFIAKNIRLLRPGGVAIMITSASTMDRAASTKFREWTNSLNGGNADFLGAIRLPNNAFESNAGTQVTTDILVFQKRKTPVASELNDFRNLTEIRSVERDGETTPIYVNEYYAKNPENMIGTMQLAFESGTGGLYGDTDQTLVAPKGTNIDTRLGELVNSVFPENVMSRTQEYARPAETINTQAKEGLLVKDNDKVFISTGSGQGTEVADLKPKQQKIAIDYIDVRNQVADLVNIEQDPDATDQQIQDMRNNLNKQYDAFVKNHGTITKNNFLNDIDIDYPLAASVEKVQTQTITETNKKVVVVSKAEIFSKRINYPRTEPDKADNIKDAISISIAYRNHIDTGYVARMLNKPVEQVEKDMLAQQIAFVNPDTGLFESSNQYLSGNVRKKLAAAERAANDDPVFGRNVDALKTVVPADLPASVISFGMGVSWLPGGIYETFAHENFGVGSKIRYLAAVGKWQVTKGAGEYDSRNTTTFAAGGRTAMELFEDKMNNKQTIITETIELPDGGKTTRTNTVKTAEAQDKQNEINDLFVNYVRNNEKYKQILEQNYNEHFNAYVIRQYELPPFDHFPGASHSIKLRDHQKRAVLRNIAENTLDAHSVGSGKTFTIITTAMEMRRLGTARKPLIAVQNATRGQFVTSFKKLYPAAKLLVPSDKEMSTEGRQRLFARIATGDWDAVIVPQSQLDMIPDSPERLKSYILEQLAEIRELKDSMDASTNYRERKQLDRQIEDLEGQIDEIETGVPAEKKGGKQRAKAMGEKINRVRASTESQANRRVDNIINFEQMNIDALLVDEAHAYKRLGFTTNLKNIRGIDTSKSKRSLSVLFKSQYVNEKTGGKNVNFFTGTPITNTMAEVWTMLRYLAPNMLEEMGIKYFDQFAQTFGEVVPSLEQTGGGTYKVVNRFSKFKNLPELVQAFRTVADVVTNDDVREFQENNDLPKLKDDKITQVVVPLSDALKKQIGVFRQTLLAWQELPGKQKMEQRHIPLLIFNRAKQAAIDLRLIDPAAVDDPESKVNQAIDRAMQLYDDFEGYKGVQMIFSDKYNSPEVANKYLDDEQTLINPAYNKARFNLYQDVKQKLIERGVPENQIAVLTDPKYDKKENKEKLFDDANNGVVRFLLGSTDRMGVGVNAQERLIGLHHLDAPDRPDQFEQRNGRMIRQGNMFAKLETPVNVFAYGVEKTMDSTAFQRLMIKQSFINQVMKGQVNARETEDPAAESDPTFEEMMASLSDSQYAMKKVMVDKNLRDERMRRDSHATRMIEVALSLRNKKRGVEDGKQRLKIAKDVLPVKNKIFPDNKINSVEIEGIEYNEKISDALNDHLQSIVDKASKEGKASTTVAINGITANLNVEYVKSFDEYTGQLVIPQLNIDRKVATPSGAGFLSNLRHELEAIEAAPQRWQNLVEKETANIAVLETASKEKFDDTRLKRFEAESKELEAKILQESKEREDQMRAEREKSKNNQDEDVLNATINPRRYENIGSTSNKPTANRILRDGSTVYHTLQRLVSRFPGYKNLVGNLIKGDLKSLGVKIHTVNPDETATRAYYVPSLDIIQMHGNFENIPETVLHEVVHALTSRKIPDAVNSWNDKGAQYKAKLDNYLKGHRNTTVGKLIEIYLKAIEQEGLNNYFFGPNGLANDRTQGSSSFSTERGREIYGFLNLHEFLAESFTNPLFQEKLKRVSEGKQSLWDRFKEWVRKVIGISNENKTAFDKVLDAGQTIIQQQRPNETSVAAPVLNASVPSPLSRIAKMRQDAADNAQQMIKDLEEKVFGSITVSDNDLKKKPSILNQILNIPNSIQDNTFGRLTDAAGEQIKRITEKGLASKNKILRTLAKSLNSIFANIGKSTEDIIASEKFNGEARVRAVSDAVQISKTLRQMLDHNEGSLDRISRVIDPTFYQELSFDDFKKAIESEVGPAKFAAIPDKKLKDRYDNYREVMGFDNPDLAKVTIDDLTPEEKKVHDIIRFMYDTMHELNFAMGKLTPEVYEKNKGNYSARLYDKFEIPEESREVLKSSPIRIDEGMYMERGDINEWKLLNRLSDPIYAVTKRMYQTMANKAIIDYAEHVVANMPEAVETKETKGYRKLGFGYGALSGKWVRDDVAEDFIGYFYADAMMQKFYDFVKKYDRLGVRQFYKKLYTVYTPGTHVGNIMGNNIFSGLIGINPIRLNSNIPWALQQVKEYSGEYRYLLSNGLLQTDFTKDDLVKSINTLEDMADRGSRSKNPLRYAKEQLENFYSGTDDVYKIAAFKSLLDQGYTPKEALNKVKEGFQNYKRVGKSYDLFSKVPIIGNPFGKFSGDLQRIVKNGLTRHPLNTMAFLAALKGLSILFSRLSGEDPEKKRIRERRAGMPKIPLPDWAGGDIPLAWKAGDKEMNVARIMSPLFMYGSDEGDQFSMMMKLAPTQWESVDWTQNPGGKVAANIAKNARDPILAPVVQLLVNSDFRGVPILDPDETKYKPSTLTQKERAANGLRFMMRSYVPYGATGDDIVQSIAGNEDYYGRVRSVGQIMLSFLGGVKMSEFPDTRYGELLEQKMEGYGYKFAQEGRIVRDLSKQFSEGKIDQETYTDRVSPHLEEQAKIVKKAQDEFFELTGRMGGIDLSKQDVILDSQTPTQSFPKVELPKIEIPKVKPN